MYTFKSTIDFPYYLATFRRTPHIHLQVLQSFKSLLNKAACIPTDHIKCIFYKTMYVVVQIFINKKVKKTNKIYRPPPRTTKLTIIKTVIIIILIRKELRKEKQTLVGASTILHQPPHSDST